MTEIQNPGMQGQRHTQIDNTIVHFDILNTEYQRTCKTSQESTTEHELPVKRLYQRYKSHVRGKLQKIYYKSRLGLDMLFNVLQLQEY